MLDPERRADRNHHPAAGLELVQEWRRNVARRGGDQDGVVRRMRFPAVVTIADANLYVGIAHLQQPPRNVQPQGLDDLDRVDGLGQVRHHRRLVARAGADLEHLVAWLRRVRSVISATM